MFLKRWYSYCNEIVKFCFRILSVFSWKRFLTDREAIWDKCWQVSYSKQRADRETTRNKVSSGKLLETKCWQGSYSEKNINSGNVKSLLRKMYSRHNDFVYRDSGSVPFVLVAISSFHRPWFVTQYDLSPDF